MLVLAAGVLSACASTPEPTEPTPLFTSEADAFAAAEETYRAYVDALNQVDLSDPETFEDVYAWTTGDANAGERKSLSTMHADGWAVRGDTLIQSVEVEDFAPTEEPIVLLGICTDVHAVEVFDASGESVVSPDRPTAQSSIVAFTSDRASPTGLKIAEIVGGGESCAP